MVDALGAALRVGGQDRRVTLGDRDEEKGRLCALESAQSTDVLRTPRQSADIHVDDGYHYALSDPDLTVRAMNDADADMS